MIEVMESCTTINPHFKRVNELLASISDSDRARSVGFSLLELADRFVLKQVSDLMENALETT